MAFLDFIKVRNQAASAPANEQSGPRPETAKQMYTREAAQEQANTKPVQSFSPADHTKMAEAKDLFQQGKKQPSSAPSVSAPAPADGSSSPQPMAQLSMNQDKSAPALSPTTAQMGARASEQEVALPANTPEPSRPTMARTPPSWER